MIAKSATQSKTYSYPSTPATEAYFSIAKSLASANSPFSFRSYVTSDVPAAGASAIIAKSPASTGPLLVFKSPFWLSTMSAVFCYSIYGDMVGVGPVTEFRGGPGNTQ